MWVCYHGCCILQIRQLSFFVQVVNKSGTKANFRSWKLLLHVKLAVSLCYLVLVALIVWLLLSTTIYPTGHVAVVKKCIHQPSASHLCCPTNGAIVYTTSRGIQCFVHWQWDGLHLCMSLTAATSHLIALEHTLLLQIIFTSTRCYSDRVCCMYCASIE